jgi:mannan endo-1,4-beta-mannosidase
MGGTAVRAETEPPGRHRRASFRLRNLIDRFPARLAAVSSKGQSPWLRPDRGKSGRLKLTRAMAIAAAVTVAASIALAVGLLGRSADDKSVDLDDPPGSYLGVYTPGVPQSYGGVKAFTATTGIRPRVVVYYSGWLEPFEAKFASEVVKHGAVPLVQIDPTRVSVAAIAAGRYDAHLRSYATAVKAFGPPVILSFGHEMNGSWYSWGYGHTAPSVFVAAWRHIVTVFRAVGARNVIWLWTINVDQCRCRIGSPARWWPGPRYVTWVGIDGYYYKPSFTFAPLFGPTIKIVRALTIDPILISETGASAAVQPAKIADLFAGVRAYGLLGFVWFDANRRQDWRISGPAASAAFRRGAATLARSAS